MSKKKWSLLLAVFFLVQSITSSPVLSFESSPLNPPTNIDLNCPNSSFPDIYAAVCTGIAFYKRYVLKITPNDQALIDYGHMFARSNVWFDLANMDVGRKGYTRYYPFYVGDKAFIMRIFLTSERSYQPEAPILYEGSLANPAVTFQVLPSINEIISGCKIQPRRTYSSSEVDRSS